MKLLGFTVLLLGLACATWAQAPVKGAPQAQPGQETTKRQHPPFKPTPEFERLRQLAGTWEASGPEGKVVTTYRVSGDGSAVLNFLFPDTPQEMLTVFHPDGAKIMATHYCAAHNQPRMVAEPAADPKVLTFRFKDITNLSSPNDDYIEGLVITFVDADHHTQEWTSREKGKQAKFSIPFTRKN